MYVRDDCSDVDMARAILKNRGLEWQEIDVDHDAAAREQVIAWAGGRAATPTIWLDEIMLIEPGPRRLTAALDAMLAGDTESG